MKNLSRDMRLFFELRGGGGGKEEIFLRTEMEMEMRWSSRWKRRTVDEIGEGVDEFGDVAGDDIVL